MGQLSYKELYKLKKEKKLNDFHVIDKNKSFLLKEKRKEKRKYLFFLEPISVIFRNSFNNSTNKEFKVDDIYSSIQIETYFTSFKISNPMVILKSSKELYSEALLNIESFIEDNKLIIENNIIGYNDYVNNTDIIGNNENNFNPKKLSKYFYNYFHYNKQKKDNADINNHNNNNIINNDNTSDINNDINKVNNIDNDDDLFEYDYTKNREELTNYLIELLWSEDLHFFKFCGPTSTGKSTTLLKFSRQYNSIVYLNLKTIYQLEQDNKNSDCYNIIVYEFGRLEFNDNKILDEFKKFLRTDCQNKP